MKETLRLIREARSKNNDLWMAMLELALLADKTVAQMILKDIRNNDLEITRLTGLLADED